MSLQDFDEFCDEHEVQPGEYGQAFAAFLERNHGWRGEARRVDEEPDDDPADRL